MSENGSRRGRPRRNPKGDCEEATSLAELLRDVIDASGLKRADYLKPMREAGLSEVTLYRRLRAEGLSRDADTIVDIVFDACGPVSEETRERANELVEALGARQHAAIMDDKTDKNLSPTERDVGKTLAAVDEELRLLRQERLELQKERQRLEQERFRASSGESDHVARAIAELREDVSQLLQVLKPVHLAPDSSDADVRRPPAKAAVRATADAELESLLAAWQLMDPRGIRMRTALQRTLDDVLDGARTGRYLWSHLSKVEKALFENLALRELQHEFDLADGARLAFQLEGVEFDFRFSATGQWTIPPEAQGELTLVTRMDHGHAQWEAGMVRTLPEVLSREPNRDGKRRLNADPEKIRYLHHKAPLIPNVLQGLTDEDRLAILAPQSGQRRVEELLRRVQGQMIRRATIATVARQLDVMKRVRDATLRLAAEGIIVLSGRGAAEATTSALGLPRLSRDCFVSLRLVRQRGEVIDGFGIDRDGERWVPAAPDDAPEPIPRGMSQLLPGPRRLIRE